MPSDLIIGIDLGTTNSLVAYMEGDRPVVIPGEDGSNLVPSVVALDERGQIVVGNTARKYLIETPDHAAYSVKRLMGRGVEDVRDELPLFPSRLADDIALGDVMRIKLGDKAFTPPEISAFILRQLKRNAERAFAAPVTKAVITVPAYFNDAQRQATKDAGRIAGLEVLRLVNEPTAAALAYGLHKQKRGNVAVYDFGGGTFDISLLKLISTNEGDIYQVLATNGDTHLGGDDIDNALLELARREIRERFGVEFDHRGEAIQTLRKSLIRAKHELSAAEKTIVQYPLESKGMYIREITRAEFDELIRPIIARTMAPVKMALADAKLAPKEMDEVVLVGGSTRIPLVRKTVGDYFQRAPHCELDPDEVVALGAAVQADILETGVKTMLLLDVTPLSLGIETMGGVIAKIIPRNSTIPASAQELFTTGVENQTAIDVHVLQGERELAKDCRSLARFQLKTPPGPAGLARIEVKFLIDANGILQVAARDLRTSEQHTVEVQPSYGLSDTEIERMLEESIEYAEQDFAERQVIEARTEAETILAATDKALADPRSQEISAAERKAITESESQLRTALAGSDYKLMRTRIDEINAATAHLAEVLMNGALQTAFEGKRLDDV
jgi:Fe-S protein assembly chaperone HscA